MQRSMLTLLVALGAAGQSRAEPRGFQAPLGQLPPFGQQPPDGYLGLTLFEAAPAMPKRAGAASDSALMVLEVRPEGPSSRAGIRVGDILLSVAGRKVNSQEDLRIVLWSLQVGETIPVQILRNRRRNRLIVTIGARPAQAKRRSIDSKRRLLQQLRITFGLPAMRDRKAALERIKRN